MQISHSLLFWRQMPVTVGSGPFFLRSLRAGLGRRPTEKNTVNYSSVKLELTLKWAMTEKFRKYLLGQKCTVFTDKNPLSYLQSAKLGAMERGGLPSLPFLTLRSNVVLVAAMGMLMRSPGKSLLSAPCPHVVSTTQTVVSVFPSHPPSNLRALQEADPVLRW